MLYNFDPTVTTGNWPSGSDDPTEATGTLISKNENWNLRVGDELIPLDIDALEKGGWPLTPDMNGLGATVEVRKYRVVKILSTT
jgi:hypothetical protein